MRKLVVVVIVAIAGLVAFNYVTTGEFALVPSFSKSEEEREVHELRDRFSVARRQFAQAHRAAAIGGIDTTAEADAAISSIKQIKEELASLRKELTEERATRKADELATLLREFEKETG